MDDIYSEREKFDWATASPLPFIAVALFFGSEMSPPHWRGKDVVLFSLFLYFCCIFTNRKLLLSITPKRSFGIARIPPVPLYLHRAPSAWPCQRHRETNSCAINRTYRTVLAKGDLIYGAKFFFICRPIDNLGTLLPVRQTHEIIVCLLNRIRNLDYVRKSTLSLARTLTWRQCFCKRRDRISVLDGCPLRNERPDCWV